MFDQMLKVIFLKMKETRKKVIWEQSVRAKLEEKYRHKRWNERGGGRGKNGYRQRVDPHAWFICNQRLVWSREERKTQGDDREGKTKRANQLQLSYVHKF